MPALVDVLGSEHRPTIIGQAETLRHDVAVDRNEAVEAVANLIEHACRLGRCGHR